MFERFTRASRSVVIDAQAHARRLGHRPIGTEHLLLAIASAPGTASDLLSAAGVTANDVESDLATMGGPTRSSDRDDLASIGIDLDRVLDAATATFGADAVDSSDRDSPRGRRARHRHRRADRSVRHLPFSARAKTALGLALRESIRIGTRSITPEHVLLGVLREGRGLACEVLARRHVSFPVLRADLEQSLRAAV